jgi:plastocyanin
MRHLVSLALVYALVVVLVLPGSLLAAQDEAQPAAGEGDPSEQPAQSEPGVEQPGPPNESTAPEQPATEPAPQPQPEPAAPAAPAQEETAAPATEPDPAAPSEKDRAKPVARKAQSGSVTITDFEFTPASITVNVGDTVTWTNNGPTAHSATASNGSFDTGTFPRGQSRSHTFDAAGSFRYICTPHPFMKGSVTVQGASSGGGGTSGGDSSGAGNTGSSDTGGSAASGSGSALPNSGGDAGALALLGLLLVALGVATRRQALAQAPADPGRIGW